MRNTRGQLRLIGLGILSLIVIIILALFLISTKVRFIVVGVVLLVPLMMILLKGDMNKIKGITAIVLFIASMFFLFGSGILQEQFPSETTVYKPLWGSLGCIKDDSPSLVLSKYLNQQQFFKCGIDAVVDNCNFVISLDRDLTWLQNDATITYQICDMNGNNCGVNKFSSKMRKDIDEVTITVNNGQSLKISIVGQPWANILVVNEYVQRYRLWTEEGGGHWLTRSADCCLADQSEVEKQDVKYGDWVCLDKIGSNKYKNYITDWVPTVGKTYTYLGSKVVCGNLMLYKLVTQKMANGITYNIQGDPIKEVQCCPHQTANCDSTTFTFIPKPEERECTYSYECENGGNAWAISDTQAVKETCNTAGKCIRSTLTIECASDAKCVQLYGSKYVCDLTIANFGKCIQSGLIPLPYCGDGVCQTGETIQICAIDCAIIPPVPHICKWYQDEIPAGTTEYCGVFGWRNIFNNCKTGTYEATCRTPANWIYFAFAGLIIFIIAMTAIKSKSKLKKKKVKKK